MFVLRVAAYVSLWPAWWPRNLAERLFYLSGDFERERVQALREVTDIAQKIIVKDDGGDGGKKSRGGGNQGMLTVTALRLFSLGGSGFPG